MSCAYRRTILATVFIVAVSLSVFLVRRPPVPASPEEAMPQTETSLSYKPLSAFEHEKVKQKQYQSAPLPPLTAASVSLPPLARDRPGIFRVVALPARFDARALNNKGEIAGTWDGNKPALWVKNRLHIFSTGFDPLENVRCVTACLSNASVIGGLSIEDGSGAGGSFETRNAVLWYTSSKSATSKTIGHLPDLSKATLYGLNARGQAVGTGSTGNWQELGQRENSAPEIEFSFESTNAFYWDGRQMLNLGRGMACGINERGQVVGSQDGKIVIWKGSEKRILGDGMGFAINNREQILADSLGYPNQDNEAAEPLSVPLSGAVLLDHGKSTAIGSLPGDLGGRAKSLNDRGEVVGKSERDPSSAVSKSRAFLWRAGQMYDLNRFIPMRSGWILGEARSINNKGCIVGEGTLHGKLRSFLLIPK